MLWVDVIGMAMGDKDGIEISKSTPGPAEVTGVDEDSLPSCFNEDAGVSQMRNSHTSSLPPASRGGNQFSHIRDRNNPTDRDLEGTSGSIIGRCCGILPAG